ncbi:MAG: DUF4340 domain-containing protein [Verrucomicrobia subdivision 3 bacterium]|nr:DUF4340 domain-containing protein [Limisphaerales bacterium]
MKTKQLISMVALLVVTIAGYLIFSPSSESASAIDSNVGDEPMADLNIGSIAAISIAADGENGISTLRVEKKLGNWVVAQRGGYPADTSRIEGLVKNLIAMKILRRVPASKSQLDRLHLKEPGTGKTAATRIEFFAADGKSIKIVHLGKELSAPGGEENTSALGGGGNYPDRRFIMLDAKPASAAVVDQTFSNANAVPSDWINRTDFFDVKNVLTLAVDYPGTEATNSWKLTRENTATNWTLVAAREGEALDQSKLNSLGQPFQSPTFNDVLIGDAAAASISTNATRITLGTEDHFTYTISLGKPNEGGDFPMRLAVSAKLPEKRIPTKDEKPNAAANLDLQWLNQQRQLKIRLALHQSYSGEYWTYLVPGYTITDLLKKRSELMAPKPTLPPLGPLLPGPPSLTPIPPNDP